MNHNGELRTWGDTDFARKLVEFAKIEVDDEPDTLASIFAKLRASCSGPRPTATGGPRTRRTTRPT